MTPKESYKAAITAHVEDDLGDLQSLGPCNQNKLAALYLRTLEPMHRLELFIEPNGSLYGYDEFQNCILSYMAEEEEDDLHLKLSAMKWMSTVALNCAEAIQRDLDDEVIEGMWANGQLR